MNDEAIAKFGQSLRGTLIGRDHSEYDEARKLYNGMIDKRPLMIARCADVADVISAVNFGRESKLPIAIRGGGHNGPGLASVDDGLVIDLSTMKGVRVDPKNRTVRVGPGCTTGDVDHATHAFGQAVPFGVVSTTGVGGHSNLDLNGVQAKAEVAQTYPTSDRRAQELPIWLLSIRLASPFAASGNDRSLTAQIPHRCRQ